MLFVLLCSNWLAPFVCGFDAFELHSTAIKLLPRRKREFDTAEDRRQLFCVKDCFDDFMIANPAKARRLAAISPENLFKIHHFNQGCEEYSQLSRCFDSCVDLNSDSGQKALAAFRPFEMICVMNKTDLLAHLPCFTRTADAVKRLYDDDCGGVAKVTEAKKAMAAAIRQNDIQAMLDALSHVCSQVKCVIVGQRAIRRDACPSEPGASTLFGEFGRLYFEGLQQVFQTLPVDMLPPQCRPPTVTADGDDWTAL